MTFDMRHSGRGSVISDCIVESKAYELKFELGSKRGAGLVMLSGSENGAGLVVLSGKKGGAGLVVLSGIRGGISQEMPAYGNIVQNGKEMPTIMWQFERKHTW